MPGSSGLSARFFVALLLPLEVETYANRVIAELGDRYRTRTAKAAPHITLQPPFLWKTDAQSLDALGQEVKAIAAAHPPVPVSLSGFGAFKPRVVYLNVNKTEALLGLQAGVAHHLAAQLNIVDPTANRGYSPHVTVASRNLSPTLFRRIWDELQDRPVQFEFLCDRLTLLVYKERWYTHSEYALAKVT
ncbi:MAG: 2'-5' RNA ligase family protein [Elainellaceae cyanobacterium]